MPSPVIGKITLANGALALVVLTVKLPQTFVMHNCLAFTRRGVATLFQADVAGLWQQRFLGIVVHVALTMIFRMWSTLFTVLLTYICENIWSIVQPTLPLIYGHLSKIIIYITDPIL
jgi:hypothetical protein